MIRGVTERQIEMNTAVEVAEAVRGGQITAMEVLRTARASIEESNELLVAFVYLDWELAERQAQRVDELVKRGDDPGSLGRTLVPRAPRRLRRHADKPRLPCLQRLRA
jgi:hypothetical protein